MGKRERAVRTKKARTYVCTTIAIKLNKQQKKEKRAATHHDSVYTNKKSIFSEVKSQTTYHYTPPSILPFAKKYQLLRVLNTNNKKGER